MNSRYPDYLEELVEEDPPYVDKLLASGERQGYEFFMETFDGVGDGVNTFVISAWPVNERITGNRYFYVTESGEVSEGDALGVMGVGQAPRRP